jgi:hypothetical protein
MAKAISKGSTGPFVRQWQAFLRGQGHELAVTGTFDEPTDAATRAFQTRHGLDVDGKVGNQTLGQAALLGFAIIDPATLPGSGFPPPPDFPPLVGSNARQALFGPLVAVADPTAGNPERVRITNGWDRDNIVMVELPQLQGIKGAPSRGRVAFHRKAAGQLQALWRAWGDAGLLDRVLSWGGAFVPRFIRGKPGVLSNHAFGTAFDINAAFNPLGAEPAFPGMKGCVFDLVPLANRHGFYWGGHFKPPRQDGMHFEVARLG